MIHPAASGATLTIDLAAIVANWRRLAAVAGSDCAAVVKADAYGTGLVPVGRALARAGCDTFFVAHPGEGAALREVAPGAAIYVLNGLSPGAAEICAAQALRPVLGSPEEIADWRAFAAARGGAVPPAAIHIDTGMNRLGLSLAEAGALLSETGGVAGLGFPVALAMSHLVSAEIPDDPVTARQALLFAQVRALFPGVPGSLANSSGVFLPACRHDLARPGYALYGGNPVPGQASPMRAAVELVATILRTRAIGPGETVGYNGTWTARRPSLIAVIPIGYADGYPRAGGGDGDASAGLAMIGGARCPIVGRVSMDLIALDATDAPAGAARRGAPVMLIGDGLGIDEVGARAGTIGYEILTRLGRRHPRIWRE